MNSNSAKKYFFIFFKIVAWIIVSLFSLFVLVFILLQIPQVQKKLGSTASSYLSRTLETKVEISRIRLDLPKKIQIKEVFVQDQLNDTLWYSQEFKVDIDLFALFNNKVQINSLYLENVTAHIYRTLPDSTFNFDFIINAFANGDTLEKPKQDESQWDFAIYNIELKKINFTMDDQVLASNTNVSIGYFNVNLDDLDLDQNKYFVDDVDLQNATISYHSFAPYNNVEEDTLTTQLPFISVENLNFSNIHVAYSDIQGDQDLKLFMEQFNFTGLSLDLTSQNVDLEKIVVHNSDISFSVNQPSIEETEKTQESSEDQNNWKAQLGQIDFSSVSFKYNNLAEKTQDKGVDFNNLLVSSFNFAAKDVYYMQDSILADINQLSFVEKSGFEIKQLNTRLRFNQKATHLEGLFLQTGHSLIANHVEIKYPSIEAISESPAQLYLMANFQNSYVGVNDLIYFNHELIENQFIADNLGRKVSFEGELSGLVSDININNFNLRYSASTNLFVNGNIKGLPDYEQAFFMLDKILINTSKKDVQSLIPDTLLPENITIPEIMALNGNFLGTIYDFKSIMNLNTSLGNIGADVVMKIDTVLNTGTYTAHLSVVDLEAGKLLKQQELLGKFEMVAQVKGKGLALKDIQANLNANVKKAVVNNYEYNDLRIEGVVLNQNFTGYINLADENLAFDFNGNVDFSKEIPDITADILLEGADLRALNFSQEDIRVKGALTANVSGNDIDNIIGKIGIRDVLIIKNEESYRLDTAVFTSTKEGVKKRMTLISDFLTAEISGIINPSDLGLEIQKHINQHFNLHLTEEVNQKELKPQNFDFQFAVKDALILTEVLIPELQEFDKIDIKGSYNSYTSDLNLLVKAPLIIYEDITVDSLIVNINSGPKALTYSVFLAEISNPSVTLQNPALSGAVADDLISARFNLVDNNNREKFALSALIRSLENEYTVHLLPMQLILNYDQWNIPSDNLLRFTEKGIQVNNLVLEKDNQFLSINTKGKLPADTLEMVFKNFEIRSISKIIEEDNERLYRGVIDGEVLILGLQQDYFAFSSDLAIANFSYKEDTLGDINIQAKSLYANLFNIDASITGQQNEVNFTGTYEQKSQGLDFVIDVRKLELSSIESFVEETVTELTGSLRGNLLVTGTVEKPDINGTMNFQQAGFNLVPLNAYFTLKDELILFDKKGIDFNKLTIRDTLENTAIVDGYILTENYRDMFFKLNVTTKRFLALNTTEEEGDLYYGTIIVDSDLRIRGDLNNPVVDARVNLLEGSNITYVIPDEEVAAVERDGIVEFISVQKDTLSSIMENGKETEIVRTEIEGIDVRANITIDQAAILSIIIDQTTGDFLEVQGGGTISFSMDPSGAMTLTGIYEINEGNYRLSFYDLIKRDFTIRKGSSITWTGDPLNADVDISAIYTIRTSPLPLMETQTSQMDDQQQRALNQPLPFQVFLNMKGEMLQPQINFDIKLPEDRKGALDGTVNRRLQILNEQENELNKQVFALLVLNRFLAPDPLEPSEGGGLTATARSSASKILTQQLNQLASQHLRGVDLTFDVASYQDATELQVALEREFLDDRLRVEVGGRVDVEGERRRRQSGSDIAGDVAVEYLLTPDGRYRLRAFRKNEFQMLLDGDVVETGLSLIFSKDFNKFKNIFKNNKNNGKKDKEDESSEYITPEGTPIKEEE
ncbi:MAG: translocation/assembly module TamB domain-containing protein [Bacteroidota bacterium]|nr:translocation/assembly module TamB domain-containing protein [Bacteroidota bacterium]